MKKKIAILGSTGSIGKTLLDIVNQNKNLIEVSLLTAHKDYQTLIKQAKKYSVKNLIITDKESFKKIKKKKINNKIKIFNNFDCLNKILNKKIDYSMSSIVGINGLEPTLKIIKYSKVIAIANKESIICGWNLILKELNKNKTKFIPVDSEHFSLWYGLKNINLNNIDKVYITASGGPFHKLPISKFSKIKIKDAVKHPNWKMGKKISVDSSTMMNKVFEIIEAKNIFEVPINKLKILIHPQSYLHAIVKFKNGLSQMVIHDTDMKIPIYNTLYENKEYPNKNKRLDIKKLNNLNLKNPNIEKFPLIQVLKKIPNNQSLFETLIVSTNDTLVDLFLKKKINFESMPEIFFSFIKDEMFKKYRFIKPKSIDQIIKLKNIVQIKINSRYI